MSKLMDEYLIESIRCCHWLRLSRIPVLHDHNDIICLDSDKRGWYHRCYSLVIELDLDLELHRFKLIVIFEISSRDALLMTQTHGIDFLKHLKVDVFCLLSCCTSCQFRESENNDNGPYLFVSLSQEWIISWIWADLMETYSSSVSANFHTSSNLCTFFYQIK